MSAHPRRTRAGTQSGKAGSVILVIFMGAVCGVAWAVLDYKSSGGDIDRLVSRVETQIDRHIGSSGTPDPSARTTDRAAPPAPGSRKPAARPDAAAATPVVAKVEPDRPAAVEPEPATPVGTEAPPAHDPVSVKPQPVRVPPAVPPSAPLSVESHPFDVVFKAMREAESCLKAGRFEDARSQLSRYEPGRVLEKQRQEFVTLRDRCELHATLLREANITPSMDPPKLTEIEFRVPKGPFTGTVLSRNDKKVELLLLSNIAVTFETFEILQMKDLDPLRARRMVEAEFDRRKSRLSKRRPMDAFRLGEFCLRNGMPDRVAECFDQAAQVASQAGVDLVAVVREEKAEGLYDTFVFFLSIGNLQEARSTLELLRRALVQDPAQDGRDRFGGDVAPPRGGGRESSRNAGRGDRLRLRQDPRAAAAGRRACAVHRPVQPADRQADRVQEVRR